MYKNALIQTIIKKNHFRCYLEIGIAKGDCFLPIRCSHKIAVDPYIELTKRQKRQWVFKNPSNIYSLFCSETSDDFFQYKKELLLKRNIDIALIDGLHTFQQSLRDVLNTLQYLNPKGVIIMHDCLPPNEAAAFPALSWEEADSEKPAGWTGEWCGDVWKTILYLKKMYAHELDVCVINTDYGLGIIRLKKPWKESCINKDVFESIVQLTYTDLMINLQLNLNLKDHTFSELLSENLFIPFHKET
ncbi:MAG: class I SAM-dependent methyltransferase [Bacteroidetes bacterium]|nr:class I SAM-dependent methyltransferase [Bacteroidota bacterium]